MVRRTATECVICAVAVDTQTEIKALAFDKQLGRCGGDQL